MITLDDVRQAAGRIEGRVRRTPLIGIDPMRVRPAPHGRLLLKLESLQVTGPFKARGAISKLTSLSAEEVRHGIVTASGGNHGAAVAYAGWVASTPATVFVPETVSPLKAHKIESWGARLKVHGRVWDESNAAALAFAREGDLTYFHPFADPMVVAGQGTIALEILEEMPGIDVILVAIGGGGLISGIAVAAKARKPDIRIIGVEPVGCPTLYESVRAGRVVELAEVTTTVPTMAARRTEPANLELVRRHVEQIVLVSDEEMREAARLLWYELGMAVDLSGAAALAALMTGRFEPRASETVCALICGAGADGIDT